MLRTAAFFKGIILRAIALKLMILSCLGKTFRFHIYIKFRHAVSLFACVAGPLLQYFMPGSSVT